MTDWSVLREDIWSVPGKPNGVVPFPKGRDDIANKIADLIIGRLLDRLLDRVCRVMLLLIYGYITVLGFGLSWAIARELFK